MKIDEKLPGNSQNIVSSDCMTTSRAGKGFWDMIFVEQWQPLKMLVNIDRSELKIRIK